MIDLSNVDPKTLKEAREMSVKTAKLTEGFAGELGKLQIKYLDRTEKENIMFEVGCMAMAGVLHGMASKLENFAEESVKDSLEGREEAVELLEQYRFLSGSLVHGLSKEIWKHKHDEPK